MTTHSSNYVEPYISRVDEGRTHGFRVRLQRQSPRGLAKKTVVSRLFSDGQYGGREGALDAARRFKVGAIQTAPKTVHQSRAPELGAEQFGYVRELTLKVRGKNGRRVGRRVVYACYQRSSYEQHSRRWSIAKWGRAEATRLATAWLAQQQKTP